MGAGTQVPKPASQVQTNQNSRYTNNTKLQVQNINQTINFESISPFAGGHNI